ncbi:MAG: flagellar motor switch protein FliN [Gammaproteobacteria bacterium]
MSEKDSEELENEMPKNPETELEPLDEIDEPDFDADFSASVFKEFEGRREDREPGAKEDINLDVILDVPVTLSMEIGRTKINIRNLLQLNQGSVVELDRLAGEPMDVLVNGTLIAHGEVVVVNDKFGIRLTDVVSPAERVRKLR